MIARLFACRFAPSNYFDPQRRPLIGRRRCRRSPALLCGPSNAPSAPRIDKNGRLRRLSNDSFYLNNFSPKMAIGFLLVFSHQFQPCKPSRQTHRRRPSSRSTPVPRQWWSSTMSIPARRIAGAPQPHEARKFIPPQIRMKSETTPTCKSNKQMLNEYLTCKPGGRPLFSF